MNLQNKNRKQALVKIVGLILITFITSVLTSWANKPFMSAVLGQPKNSGNEPSPAVVQKQRGDSGRIFADWCREKASLSPEAKYTVEVLLKKAETTECDVANQKLSSLAALYIAYNQISDVKPLESLTNLTRLHLSGNQISDIKPLASLTNLETLFLDHNQINDIKPLQSLTNLTVLTLQNNQIRDIKPLASLTNLTVLTLSQNQISDIKPLASLTNLTTLSLWNNQISDIKPLASLTKLTVLDLSGNSSVPKTCPLEPESICKWEPEPSSY
jgi:internalin A